MKSINITIIALIAAVSSNVTASTDKLTELNLSGTVKGVKSGTIYLKRYENKSFFTIDSTTIKNGSFRFTSQLPLPDIYGLSLSGSDADPFTSFLIFLDSNPIKVEFDTENKFRSTKVSGSKEHEQFITFSSQKDKKIDQIIRENPGSLAALYLLYRYHSFRLTSEEIKSIVSLLDSSLQKSSYVTVLNELASTLDKVAVGKKASDFTAVTAKGDRIRFSEFLGKGYVLLDFWASWCAPCRKENPYILKAYETFQSKGFQVVGVSLDNSTAPWLHAIKTDKLSWHQLIDQQAWAGEGVTNYAVRLIPANFLIDSNGIIVAKNLKGEALIEKLAELLK